MPLRKSTRQENLLRIKSEAWTSKGYEETKMVFQAVQRLEQRLSSYLTVELPVDVPNYSRALHEAMAACRAHAPRINYLIYVRSPNFGKCTVCDRDIPIQFLQPSRGKTTCLKCNGQQDGYQGT